MRLKLTILLLLTTTFISSCGRFYQKDYVYIPPDSQDGRQCILQCRDLQHICENVANKAYQECLRNMQRLSTVNYNINLDTKEITKTNIDRNTEQQCLHQANHETCTKQYNDCYLKCGGEIEANRYSKVQVY